MKYLTAGWGIVGMVISLASAHADTFILNNGARLEGRKLSENADQVVVETGVGVVTLSKKSDAPSSLLKVEPGRTVLDEYDDRATGVKDSRDAEDFVRLARWAREKKLHRYVTPLMERAVVLNPDHAEARRALGYEKYEGRWMTKPELMAAKGFVYHDGRWMTPAEKEIVIGEAREADMKARIAREERRHQREEEKRQKAESAEQYRAMLEEALRRRTEDRSSRQNQNMDMPPWWWWYGYGDLFGSPITYTSSTVPQTPTRVRNLYYPYAVSPYYYPYASNPYYGTIITTTRPITPAKSLQ